MNYFTDDQLTYSAHTRCACGAGLAYPKNPTVRQIKEWLGPKHPFTMWDYWDCSDILKGTAMQKGQPGSKTHSDKYPFAFYEIKSENQPSANGATTRQK